MTAGRQRPPESRRARRQVGPAALVLAYLAAAGVTALLGDRVARGSWLALHLILLGALSNAIVAWSDHFAAALLPAPPAARPGLVAAGASLTGLAVLGHGLALAIRAGRTLATRLGHTVWFYVAAAAALLAGTGLGALLAGGVASSADAWRAMRLAHAHLNLLGWIGLA